MTLITNDGWMTTEVATHGEVHATLTNTKKVTQISLWDSFVNKYGKPTSLAFRIDGKRVFIGVDTPEGIPSFKFSNNKVQVLSKKDVKPVLKAIMEALNIPLGNYAHIHMMEDTPRKSYMVYELKKVAIMPSRKRGGV